jgi:hypothetical protein
MTILVGKMKARRQMLFWALQQYLDSRMGS